MWKFCVSTFLPAGNGRDVRITTHLQGSTRDVQQNGVQCRGAQPRRPYEEHLISDGQRREMAPFSGLRHGLRLQSRRAVDLGPPDVDKRQIQRYHQRRPARMRSQEQHQECRTDYRRSLPGGIHVAGDRPRVRSAAKDDRGDPDEYGFLLIGTVQRVPQLYFIPVFIYTFIKVKSK